VTNSTGGQIYSSNYQPFGVGHGESGYEEFRYTSKPEDDATGLYYYGARYYDPTIGRFITADTNLGSLTDPQSLNRYAYTRNNPMKYTDPEGKMPLIFLVAIGYMAASGAWSAYEYSKEHPNDTQGIVNHFLIGFDTAGINTVVTLIVGLAAPALPALEQTFSYGSPAITSVLRTASRDYLDLNERSATAADYAWSLAMGYCNYGINREVTTEIMRNIIIDDLENQLSIRIIGSLTTATWSTPLYPPLKNAISSRIDQYWLDDSIDNGYPCDYVPNRDLE
jgi:RHS repeat-associated protein